jgi:hypothetical protein
MSYKPACLKQYIFDDPAFNKFLIAVLFIVIILHSLLFQVQLQYYCSPSAAWTNIRGEFIQFWCAILDQA